MESRTKSMKWYVIKTQNNKELHVMDRIKHELEADGLSSVLGDSIIPLEKKFTLKDGKKIIKDKVMMPGYIFLETSATGEINQALRNINGAGGFVRGRDGEISPMRQREVDKLFKDHKVEQELDISKIYVEGEKVKVMDGAFATFEGVITSVDSDRQKLKLQIAIFGRLTPLELNFGQVEKL